MTLKTPLYQTHVDAGARMVPFGGWDMPVQYDGLMLEHHQTRDKVSLFDICHMGEFRVTGQGAAEFLGKMITSNVQSLPIGRCKYGLLLNNEGRIIDDLITYHLGENEFMLVVNAATRSIDLNWLNDHKPDGVTIEDISDSMAKLDVQGPGSLALMNGLCESPLDDLKYFRAQQMNVAGIDVLVSRTGYTGELGYELYFDAAQAETLWHKLVEAGAKPAGLGARDTLRLEAALGLSGQDIGPNDNPAQANMLRFCQLDKDFIGKDAFAEQAATPDKLDRIMIGFKIEGRQSARHDHLIFHEGREVGRVTSGSFSPSLGFCIGLAYVRPTGATPGTILEVDTGRKRLQAEVVNLPFYKKNKK